MLVFERKQGNDTVLVAVNRGDETTITLPANPDSPSGNYTGVIADATPANQGKLPGGWNGGIRTAFQPIEFACCPLLSSYRICVSGQADLKAQRFVQFTVELARPDLRSIQAARNLNL
ncbi:MAG: hypothetical protein JO108_06855 [Acidobacteriaceae bacterium]|nr:hypothetical protein [Acidobacteriaceae bacterium]